MNSPTVAAHSAPLVSVVPLGQTPDYLDPQSQEALHEVDVSGATLLLSFSEVPKGAAMKPLVEGIARTAT